MVFRLCQFVLGIISVCCAIDFVNAQDLDHSSDVRIAWDYSSMQQLADEGGYPRLIRLRKGNLFVIYENRKGDIHLKKSFDQGINWSNPEVIFSSYPYHVDGSSETVRINAANPEIIELDNGDILFACNYRPRKDDVAPFSIGLKKMDIETGQLSEVKILYEAGKKFIDGCWEPSFLQLPNGEVHIYFANEGPYQKSNEQEISVIKSNDRGENWSTPQTVSFRKGRRDGMPVAVHADQEIYLTVEDNKIDQFKPYIIKSDFPNSWTEPVLSDSKNRWYALEKSVDDSIYMGAPYLIKLSNGQFLLSYQTNRNRNHNWELSTMEVAIGNTEAKSFKNITQPFPVALNKEAKWNSLANWDKNTVVALSSTNFKSEKISPWLIKGYLIPNTLILSSDTADIFIGSNSLLNLKVRAFKVDNSLKITFESTKSDTEKNYQMKEYLLYINGNNTEKIVIPVSKEKVQEKSVSLASLPSNFHLGLAFRYVDNNGNIRIEKLANMTEENPETWIKIEK